MIEQNEIPRSGRPEFAVRLMHGAGKILHLTTGMPLSDASALIERCAITACRAAGLGGLPDERVPLEVRYRTVQAMVRIVDDELSVRGVAKEEREEVACDILDFYRAVRNVPADW